VPGKHAPDSPRSFYLSLARAGTGALAALGLVVAIVVVAVTSRGTDAGTPQARTTPTTARSPAESLEPSPDSSTPEPTPEARALRKKTRISVDVLNATDIAGLAGTTAERIEERGYRQVESDDAAEKPQARTAIYFAKGFEREAKRLLGEFPEFGTVRKGDRPNPGDAQLVVLIGEDYEAP
jgi:hypothetical protein